MQEKTELFHYENIFKKKNINIDDLKNKKKNSELSNSYILKKKEPNEKVTYSLLNNVVGNSSVNISSIKDVNACGTNGQRVNNEEKEKESSADIHISKITGNNEESNTVAYDGIVNNEPVSNKVANNAFLNGVVVNGVVVNNGVVDNAIAKPKRNRENELKYMNNLDSVYMNGNNTAGYSSVEKENTQRNEQANSDSKKDTPSVKAGKVMNKKKNDLSSLFDDTSYASILSKKQEEKGNEDSNVDFLYLQNHHEQYEQYEQYGQMNEIVKERPKRSFTELNYVNANYTVANVADMYGENLYTSEREKNLGNIPMNNTQVHKYEHEDLYGVNDNSNLNGYDNMLTTQENKNRTSAESRETVSEHKLNYFPERELYVTKGLNNPNFSTDNINNVGLITNEKKSNNNFDHNQKENKDSFLRNNTQSEVITDGVMNTHGNVSANTFDFIETNMSNDDRKNSEICIDSLQHNETTNHVIILNDHVNSASYNDENANYPVKNNPDIHIHNQHIYNHQPPIQMPFIQQQNNQKHQFLLGETESNNQERVNENEGMRISTNSLHESIIQANDSEQINFLKNPQILFEESAKLEIKDDYIDKMFKKESERNNILTEEKKITFQSEEQGNYEKMYSQRWMGQDYYQKGEQESFNNYEKVFTSTDKENNKDSTINTYELKEKLDKKSIRVCFGNNGMIFYTQNSTVKAQPLINLLENNMKEKRNEVNVERKKNNEITDERTNERKKEQTISDSEELLYYLTNFPGPFSRKNNKDDEQIKKYLNECINRNKAKYEENIFEYTQKNSLYNYLLNIINNPSLLHFNLINVKDEQNNYAPKKNDRKDILKRTIPFLSNNTDSGQEYTDKESSDNNKKGDSFKKSKRSKGRLGNFKIKHSEENNVGSRGTYQSSTEEDEYSTDNDENGKEGSEDEDEDEDKKEEEGEETEEEDETEEEVEKKKKGNEEEENKRKTEKFHGIDLDIKLGEKGKKGKSEDSIFKKYLNRYYKNINHVYINNWKYEFFDFVSQDFIKELHKLENKEKITMEDIYLEYFSLSIYNSKKATELCVKKNLYKYFFLILKKLDKKKYYKMLDKYINQIQTSDINEMEMKGEIKHIYRIYNYNIYDDVFIESFVFLASLLNFKNMNLKKNILVNYWYSYFTLIFHNFLFQDKENEISFEEYRINIFHFFVYLINSLLKCNKGKEAYFLMFLFSNHPFSFETSNATFIKNKKHQSFLIGGNPKRAHFDICAFQLTEIYEYICRQMNDNFFYEHLIFYKIMYTSILIEWGILDKAKKYLQMTYYYIDVIKSQKKNSPLIGMYYDLLDKTKYLFPQNNNLLSHQTKSDEHVYFFKEVTSTNEYTKDTFIPTVGTAQNTFYPSPNANRKFDHFTLHTDKEKENRGEQKDNKFDHGYKNGNIHNYAEQNYQNQSIPNSMTWKQDSKDVLTSNRNNYVTTVNDSHFYQNTKNAVEKKEFSTYGHSQKKDSFREGSQDYFEKQRNACINEDNKNKTNELTKRGEDGHNSLQNIPQARNYSYEHENWSKNKMDGFKVEQSKNDPYIVKGYEHQMYAENQTHLTNKQGEHYTYDHSNHNEDVTTNTSKHFPWNTTAKSEQSNNANSTHFRYKEQQTESENRHNFYSNPFMYNTDNNIQRNERDKNDVRSNESSYYLNNESRAYKKQISVRESSNDVTGVVNFNKPTGTKGVVNASNMGCLPKNEGLVNVRNNEEANSNSLNTNQGSTNENNIDIINLGKNIITGFFTNLKEKIKKTEEIEEDENLFYYDYEKKRWREKGVTSDEEKEREQEKMKRELEIKSIAPPPIPVNYTGEKKTLNKKDVRNRYVDYFN